MHRLDVLRQRKIDERFAARLLALGDIFVAVDIRKLAGSDGYILTVVAILGQFGRIVALENLLIAYIEREREFVYLIARVVDIELAADIIAGKVHNGRKAVAQSSAPRVAHVHGACRICGDKLNVDTLALAEIGAAVVLAFCADIHEYLRIKTVGKPEIDKSGSRCLTGGKESALKIDILRYRCGYLRGRASEHSRPRHGGVCGIVAVVPVGGNLHLKFGELRLGQLACGHSSFRCVLYELTQRILDLFYKH